MSPEVGPGQLSGIAAPEPGLRTWPAAVPEGSCSQTLPGAIPACHNPAPQAQLCELLPANGRFPAAPAAAEPEKRWLGADRTVSHAQRQRSSLRCTGTLPLVALMLSIFKNNESGCS